jgi:hypothetical protein
MNKKLIRKVRRKKNLKSRSNPQANHKMSIKREMKILLRTLSKCLIIMMTQSTKMERARPLQSLKSKMLKCKLKRMLSCQNRNLKNQTKIQNPKKKNKLKKKSNQWKIIFKFRNNRKR